MTRAVRKRNTYFILGILIVILSLYIAFRSGDRLQYVIPRPAILEGIDSLKIERSTDTVDIAQSGETWVIQPEGYPVNPATMDIILDTVAKLKLTELVSVTRNYGRFELDESNRIRITAFQDGTEVRTFDLGKRSPTYDHTFIRLSDDDRIFHSPGDLRSYFTNTREGYRDKTALSFDADKITQINIKEADRQVVLNRTKTDSSEGGSGSLGSIAWVPEEGEAWDTNEVEEVLGTLSSLQAYAYRDENERDGTPIFSISLLGDEEYSLSFYERQENLYPARSSQNDYPFTLFYAISEIIMGIGREDTE